MYFEPVNISRCGCSLYKLNGNASTNLINSTTGFLGQDEYSTLHEETIGKRRNLLRLLNVCKTD